MYALVPRPPETPPLAMVPDIGARSPFLDPLTAIRACRAVGAKSERGLSPTARGGHLSPFLPISHPPSSADSLDRPTFSSVQVFHFIRFEARRETLRADSVHDKICASRS